jgi:hypothetical protein
MEKQTRYTASSLRSDLYNALDHVLETGQSIEIERKGRILRIVAEPEEDRFSQLRAHPGTIKGDPEDLVHMDWSDEWKP